MVTKSITSYLVYIVFQILCAWDIKEYILLQKVNVKFPFSQRQPEYGPTVLTILPPSTLAITCNEYIGEYRLGTSGSVCSRWSVVSHLKPLTAAVYDSCFQQVIYTYIYTYIHHTYIHTYIHTYMHTYIHTYIHLSIHLSIHLLINLGTERL